MRIIKRDKLFEHINEKDKKEIIKTEFIGVIIDKISYKEKLEKKGIRIKRIGVLYNNENFVGSWKIQVYRYKNKNELRYFAENIVNKNIKEKRKYISYFFNKKPKKKDLKVIYSILKNYNIK